MGEPTPLEKDRSGIFDELKATLDERIMYFDGGMGTMIQQLDLSEEDFRGASQSCQHMLLDVSVLPTLVMC